MDLIAFKMIYVFNCILNKILTNFQNIITKYKLKIL